MNDDALTNAIKLIKAGKKVEARKILEPYIVANPHHIHAWLWEAETRETIAGKIKILEMCLKQNPDDPLARKAVAKLKAYQQRVENINSQSIDSAPVPSRQNISESHTGNKVTNSPRRPSRSPDSNIPKCPTCGSPNIQKISTSSKVGKAVLFGVFAMGDIIKTFKCNRCGYQW